MKPDDPNAHPTRTFAAGDVAPDTTVPPDLTRTFSGADPPPPGEAGGWPAGLVRYRPLRLLGHGAMGDVYLAHDTQLDRPVALKTTRHRPTPTAADRLLVEARAAARLHHPNVCPVFDADVCDGVPYLTMAYIDGPTLREELGRNGPCPPPTAARIARGVADAMRYAHDQGVVHRDLKPGNILLTPEHEPVVTDSGLAFRLDADDPAGMVVCGTPVYMAPELLTGVTADERTDVYALGVILFQMLVGRLPYSGIAEIMDTMRRGFPAVTRFRKDVPEALARIVATATARDPADRFPDMATFADALSDYLRQPERRPKRPRGLLFWLVAVPALVSLTFLVLSCCVGLGLPAIQKVWQTPQSGATVVPPPAPPPP